MRFLMRFSIPMKAGNAALSDKEFGDRLKQLLADMKAETAYFTNIKGQRGGYIVVNLDDASQIAALSEPMFLWLEAEVEFLPAMVIEDLEKAGPSMAAAVKKWKK